MLSPSGSVKYTRLAGTTLHCAQAAAAEHMPAWRDRSGCKFNSLLPCRTYTQSRVLWATSLTSKSRITNALTSGDSTLWCILANGACLI